MKKPFNIFLLGIITTIVFFGLTMYSIYVLNFKFKLIKENTNLSPASFQYIDNIQKTLDISIFLLVVFTFIILFIFYYGKKLDKVVYYKNEIRQFEKFQRHIDLDILNQIKKIEESLQEVTELIEKKKNLSLIEKDYAKTIFSQFITLEAMDIETHISFFEINEDDIKKIFKLLKKVSQFSQEFNAVTQEAFKNSSLIQEKIVDISKIIQVIKRITTETRLIAFNAAIEASRDERGSMGFKVVVSQIKNLVDDIEDTTNDIQDAIKELSNLGSKSTLVYELFLKKLNEREKIETKLYNSIKLLLSHFPAFLKYIEEIKEYNNKHKNIQKEMRKKIKNLGQITIKKEEIEEEIRNTIKEILLFISDINNIAQEPR